MLFHTWVFFVFFLIVYPVYLAVRKHNGLMNLWLMIASYTFYGWWWFSSSRQRPEDCWKNPYIILLFGTSAIDYVMVLFMQRSQSQKWRRFWLIISLVSNFGFLGYFKYSGFITENLNWVLEYLGSSIRFPDPVAYPDAVLGAVGAPSDWLFTQVVLPVGISFHTFQSMSYTIDAYRGNIQTERNPIRFLTFVSFFPQLVAGPIERASNLLPQLQRCPRITREDITDGLSLFLVGFFKKVALADYLALYVDKVYGAPGSYQSAALVLATVAFGWQIYFDFSGYTDMARGIARVMGFHLMLNFNNPYVATGLGDFWARWHISLSTWFKDYLYFPLGGNRGGKLRTYFNMTVTMVVSGIWHGAGWTFVIWGALHALGRIVTRELERTWFYRERVPTFAKQMFVFAFVTLTWVFFRAKTVGDAWLILTRIFTTRWVNPQLPLLMVALVLAVWLYQFMYTGSTWSRRALEWKPVPVGLAILMLAYLAIVAQPSTQAFIYFQF
ncbi:MAG TPA: MBOAT family O-acyltransferase [Gemmataceae bacterium]|nr:MBOAT family O-acyltransferase [Gemmataceae bacterium]